MQSQSMPSPLATLRRGLHRSRFGVAIECKPEFDDIAQMRAGGGEIRELDVIVWSLGGQCINAIVDQSAHWRISGLK
jgi:hypothetical protein